MAVASSDLDTADLGSKIVRTEGGVFLATPDGGTQELDAGDPAELLPVGSVLKVTATDSLVIEASIPLKGRINTPTNPTHTATAAEMVVTTDLTTVDDILGALETWRTSFNTAS